MSGSDDSSGERRTNGASEGGGGRPGKPPRVVSSAGHESRFLRGMITHDLVQRGVAFDPAYSIARSVRAALSGRDSVRTSEIRDLIERELEARYGTPLPDTLLGPWERGESLRVNRRGDSQPFSKGLLAESIHASGVSHDRAYELVAELEATLRDEGVRELSSFEIGRRVDEILEQRVSVAARQRYRTLRRIERLPRPVIVYIGGASATGKSSLALQLAPLLRIYRVTATDTIRQVMRMVFTPKMLPALHRSSFESSAAEPGHGDAAMTSEEAWEAFVAQAERVAVGVRAVVERAIEENLSIIVEGVHLLPGAVPFPDLDDKAYQVSMVVGTVDREAHRTRMLARAATGTRRADRYLGALTPIRAINDRLLQEAELHDIPLVDTFRQPEPELLAVQIVTAALERMLPAPTIEEWGATANRAPTLLIIIDGVADRPVRALGGRTPLQAARLPTLDRLAAEGRTGLADAIAPGVVADTAAGTLALFAQSPRSLERGPVEALGAGLELRASDVALRANLATVDDSGNLVDRRAGRIREDAEELAAALDRLGRETPDIEIRVASATEHRLAIVLRGSGMSSAILGSDPGDAAVPDRPLLPRPVDEGDAAAARTATILADFEARAAAMLEEHPVNRERKRLGKPVANRLITRGAGHIHRLLSLEEAGTPLRVHCVGGDRTILGLARWVGAQTTSHPSMTANLDTDLAAKFAAVTEALDSNDLTVLHVKGADIAAHDRRPDLKVRFLELLDEELGRLLAARTGPLRIAVASDHATLSESGQHAADPLPVLIWGHGVEPDEVDIYDESAAAGGGLGRFPLQELLGRLFFDLG